MLIGSLFGLISQASYLINIYTKEWVYKSIIFAYIEIYKNNNIIMKKKYGLIINKGRKLPYIRNKLKNYFKEDLKKISEK